MNVSRETLRLLAQYRDLLTRWNARINLVSPNTLADVEYRHVADSLQLADHPSNRAGHWVDLGSGGGLPGIVLAVALRKEDARITLIESDQRKCAFLRTAARELGLSQVKIIPQRIEEVPPQQADYVTARALAPLSQLLGYVARHLSPAGTALLLKGRTWRDEIDAARADWRFHAETFPSNTDPEAAILKISGVSDVRQAYHRDR